MLFSSPVFLFGFLPVTLFIYYFSPKSVKNLILLLCSLFFYAWGEVFYLAVMLISISANYIFGLLIYKYQELSNKKLASLYVTMGVGVNIILLISFKYSNFIVDNINVILSFIDIQTLDLATVHLPLGISFFTFQAISYIVDVYRKEVPAQRNIFNLALYISLFPQLIAGPIVRYHDVALQITNRTHSIELFQVVCSALYMVWLRIGESLLLRKLILGIQGIICAVSIPAIVA
jgi:alginate O-acetyltransferase complex protein AlgI